MKLTITLPWPPATNNLYAVVRGRKIKSSAGRKYTEAVQAEIWRSPTERFSDKRVSVVITYHQPTRRNVDLDGRLKAPLDALTQCGVWADDSQVDRLTVVRGEIVKGGSVDVEIETL